MFFNLKHDTELLLIYLEIYYQNYFTIVIDFQTRLREYTIKNLNSIFRMGHCH